MTYDTLGRPNIQTDANGNTTTLFFAGTRTEIDDPVGTAHVSYFTARGKTVASIEGLGSSTINSGAGNLTTSTYDGLGRLLTTTLPAGNGIAYTYDSYSNPLTVTQTPIAGSGLASLTTSFTYGSPVAAYPNFEEVLTVTDPRGLVMASSYDSSGNRISVVADVGSGHFNATGQFTYDSLGRVLTATNALGVVTAYSYDGFGNLTSTIADYGPGCGTANFCQQTAMTYDLFGNVVALTDPKGNVSLTSYDLNRRPVMVTLPGAPTALVTTTTYDPDGRVLQVQQFANGQALRTTSSSYTLTGKPATVTDANGNTTSYSYDGNDRLSLTVDPLGRTTSYVYDTLSRPFQTFNLAIQSGALGQRSYTANGKLASLIDANSHTTQFAYDGLDRLGTTTYPATSAYPSGTTEVLTYDVDSNVLTRTTRRGDTITLTYDTLNRLATKTPPSPAPVVTYSYDLVGRLIGVSDTSAAITAASTAASYASSYSYDALNRPVGITWSPTLTQTTPTASGSGFTFGYDNTNRLISQAATDKNWWSYPATASSIAYTANALNQYSAVGSTTPTYDANGNLTFDGSFTYCYDAESRLTGILSAGTCASPTTTVASYAYDAQGRRKSKTVGGVTTVFVTDVDNREVIEYAGSGGATQAWYAYGLGANEVLNRMNVSAGTRQTMIPDRQGSIFGLLDSGGALAKAGYQSFGENPSMITGSFRYTGQRFDAETAGSTNQPSGLYYYRARMYSPALGRFLQADPIGYAGGGHLYAYVGNDPLNGVDPNGLATYFLQGSGSVVGVLGGAFGVGVYATTNNAFGLPDIGVFRVAGPAVGLNVGAGISVGYASGSSTDFRGRTLNVDVGVGPVIGSVSFTPKGSKTFNSVVGGSGGFGYSPTVAGIDLSSTTTRASGVLENLILPAFGLTPSQQDAGGDNQSAPGVTSLSTNQTAPKLK